MFAGFFKALGEPTRLKIIRLLAEKELCVCELEEIMQISQPRISQHLKVLTQAGLISERREGQKRMCWFNQNLYNETMQQFRDFMSLPLPELEGFEDESRRLLDLDGMSCQRKIAQEILNIDSTAKSNTGQV